MVKIKFADTDSLEDAIGFLAEYFTGHVLASEEVIVPEPALAALVGEGFSFTVLGKATHEQTVAAFRGPVPDKVQRRKAGAKKVVRKGATRSR